jgi:hypothetical protein
MSLVALANHLAEKGRGDDKMLVHMTPGEVQGLQALALASGGSLTINPETGLPEANFLKKLLPTIIGAGISYFSGGTIDPMTAAAIVGGVETARTGDLGKGISAGLGAYGGASFTASMAGAGTTAGIETAAGTTGTPIATDIGSLAAPQQAEAARLLLETGADKEVILRQLQKEALEKATTEAATRGFGERALMGLEGLTSEAGRGRFMEAAGGLPGLVRTGYMAAAPMLAAEAVKERLPQTTTKPPTFVPRTFNPITGTYTARPPIYGAGGGLMGLAEGGVADSSEDAFSRGGMFDFSQRSEPVIRMANGGATEDQIRGLYQDVFKREADPGGLQFWQQSGYSPEQIRAEFMKSPEYTSMQGQQAVPYAQGNPASQQDITNAYYNLLGRAPDQGGLAFYQSSQFSPEQIRQNIMQSPEYQAFQAGPKTQTQLGAQAIPYAQGTAATQDEIKNIYKQLLRREADVGGLEFYGASRFSPEQIRQEIMKSEEFRGLPAFVDEPAPVAFQPTAPTAQEVRTTYEQGGGATQMPSVNVLGAGERPMTQNAVVDKLQAYLAANPNATSAEIMTWGRVNGVPEYQLRSAVNERRFNMLTGGSKQAFDYLMGRGDYPLRPYTPTGELMRPYAESVLGAPENRKVKKLIFDPTTRTYKENPEYVERKSVVETAPIRDVGGNAVSMSSVTETYFRTNPDVKAAWQAGNTGMTADEYALFHWNTFGRTEGRSGWTGASSGGGGGGGGGGTDSTQQNARGGLAALAGGGMSRMRLMGVEGGAARGGHLGDYSDGGRLLRGPGDGVSDSIPATIAGKRPARLADGEFVVPARIVSELGNGSTEAGARKLYAMMDRIQAARRKSVGKGKVAKNTRADKYLPA